MIRETVEIQCDKCGRHAQTQKMIPYRISGLMQNFMIDLEINGWKFERNDGFELTRVLCPNCKSKIEEQISCLNTPNE